jgi:hypothetical protein
MIVELSLAMIVKLGAIVTMTPVFLGPGLFIGMLGGGIGRIYMKAQLSVKREMSNAKAPVLGHFGAAIAGLSEQSPSFYVCKVSHSSKLQHRFVRMVQRMHSKKNP